MDDFDDFEALGENAEDLNVTLASTGILVSGFDSELRRMRTSLAATNKDMASLEKGLSKGLRQAFDGAVFDGMKLSDALKTVAKSLSDTVYAAAIKPVTSQVSGLVSQGIGSLVQGILPSASVAAGTASAAAPSLLGGLVQGVQNILPFEDGAPFSQGKVMPFADGAPIVQGRVMPFADGAPISQGRVVPFAQGGIVSSATPFPMRGGVSGVMGEAGPEAIMPLARGPDGKLGVRGGSGGGDVSIVMNISTPDVQGFQRSQSQIAAQMSRALSAGNRNR